MVGIIGHRGWPRRFPDNSLAGFTTVLPHVDGVELDVRRSGDGRLVVAHDPVLNGMEVASNPWSALAELDIGDGHHPVLLDEALSAITGTPAQIEIKNDPKQPGYEPDHRLGMEAAERSRPGDVVTSFNRDTVRAVRRAFPEVETGVILGPSDQLDAGIAHALQAGHRLVAPHVSLLLGEGGRIDHGLLVTPWVVNEMSVAMELAGRGVTAIISDDPPALAGIRS